MGTRPPTPDDRTLAPSSGSRALVTVLATLVLASLVLPATTATHVEERVIREPYDLSAPGPFASVEVPNPTPVFAGREARVGGFATVYEEGETTVEVFILDDSGRKVPGRIAYYDGADELIGLTDFCFHVEEQIPEGTAEIDVFPSPLVQPCKLKGLNYGPATMGELVATFT